MFGCAPRRLEVVSTTKTFATTTPYFTTLLPSSLNCAPDIRGDGIYKRDSGSKLLHPPDRNLMFHGHVDNVSRQQIEGWAADDAAPEQPIDISILVNGRRVAQVLCDEP